MDEYPRELREKLPSVRELADLSSLQFGAFTLTFRLAPGHSPCSMYTIINERYVHVADNLMAANDGTAILPWAEFERVGEHIRSLEMLQVLGLDVLLLGHGKSIVGKKAISQEVDNRLLYPNAVKEGNGDIGVEEATAACARRFLCEHWHIRRSQ